MRRKGVSRRRKSIAEVRSSLQAHRGRVGDRLEARPASKCAGSFSYQAHFDHMDEELAAVERELIKAEDAHVRLLIRIRQLRRQSRELTSQVYDKQTSARQVLIGLYGSEHDFELAATSGDTPRVPQTLAEQVDQTVKLLREPEGDEPNKKVEGIAVDNGVLADDLEGDLERLDTTRTAYQRSKKQADGTRKELRAALTEVDRVFPWVAANLESLFRLADERELADRIRTSIHRVTRRRNDGEEETQPESAAEESAVEESAVEESAVEESAAEESVTEESAAGPPAVETAEAADAASPAG